MSTMGREEIVAGALGDYHGFAELLRGLDDAGLTTPTRCDGWTVAHVAGHVVGQLDDITNLRFAEASAPDSPDKQAARNLGRAPAELATELDVLATALEQALAGFDDAAWDGPVDPSLGTQTVGEGVLALWDDTYVHADDVRSALGQTPDRGPGLRAGVVRVAQVLTERGWGPATLVLDGMERIDIGGGGHDVTGDPYEFLMVATGRADPAVLGLDETVNVYR